MTMKAYEGMAKFDPRHSKTRNWSSPKFVHAMSGISTNMQNFIQIG